MLEKKNQLHQLLAVERDLNQKANQILHETLNTFAKKPDHFDGLLKVYSSYDDNGEKIPPESKEMVTTVSEKVRYTLKSVISAINAELSKEETNASGTVKAELKVGDISFGEFSAIALLSLEKTILGLRGMYKQIPTLDPTKLWNKEDDIYETSPEVKYRTIKRQEPLIVVPATKEHPAQVQILTKDIQVGKYTTTYKSGRITPTEKSKLLQRIDDLIVAIKKAKAQSNQAQVINIQVGKNLVGYINEGIL